MPAHAAKPADAGAPADALASFGSALVAAAGSPVDRSDSHVAVAFGLGWQMAELYRPHPQRRSERRDGDLPGMSAVSDDVRLSILVDQLQAGIAMLADAIAKAGLPPVSVDSVRAALDSDQLPDRVLSLHRQLLGALTATDFRLGKAYGLGRALADTSRKPADLAGIRAELAAGRIANLRNWLDELSSALPPHAAHSVSDSLRRWTAWAAAGAGDERALLAQLRRQGELWRAVLSGEKRATDLLEIDNYLEAADQAASQMKTVFRQLVGRFPVLVGLVAGLLVVGIALLLWGGGSQDVAGATSLLVALGLTWKGVGTTLGQLAGHLEQPIWGAVLDLAVADAITLLPDTEHDHAGRRALAVEVADGG